LKANEIKRLKLKCDELLSSFAFKFNLRHRAKEAQHNLEHKIEAGPARNYPPRHPKRLNPRTRTSSNAFEPSFLGFSGIL